MTDANGWPDKPGVPANPERRGAHRLRHQESGIESDKLWSPAGEWIDDDGEFGPSHAAEFYDYLGPCHTPQEVAAREAAAELRGRRDGCALLPELPLEALPLPDGSDALARIRAEAYREGMEAAAVMHDQMATDLERIANEHRRDGLAGFADDDMKASRQHRDHAAAIRAAAKEVKP